MQRRTRLQTFADAYLAECFTRKRAPQVTELAARLKVPISKFSRVFFSLVHKRPSTYLKLGQVEHVKHLLATTNMTFQEIADAAGYRNLTTMFRSFRRINGNTPGAFRATHLRRSD